MNSKYKWVGFVGIWLATVAILMWFVVSSRMSEAQGPSSLPASAQLAIAASKNELSETEWQTVFTQLRSPDNDTCIDALGIAAHAPIQHRQEILDICYKLVDDPNSLIQAGAIIACANSGDLSVAKRKRTSSDPYVRDIALKVVERSAQRGPLRQTP